MNRAARKLLLTGSAGMLATDCARVAEAAGYDVAAYTHRQMDITDEAHVRQVMEAERPDVVVNTPGLTVDHCEVRPEDGYRLHTWATTQLARACERRGAIFVYVSTCGLFGDEIKPYAECDPVILKTHYARSKYLGEHAAAQACARTFVIRPGWLFGGHPMHRKNFVYQRYLEAREHPVIRSANDKFGSPTYTEDVARKLLELLETDAYGTYHLTNAGGCSRYDYVRCIVQAFGLTTVVEPVDSSHFVRPAPVPNCEILANSNMRSLGLEPLGPWEAAIQRYVNRLEEAFT